nr:HNH endonuclease [uncultured Roseococcus sp.]
MMAHEDLHASRKQLEIEAAWILHQMDQRPRANRPAFSGRLRDRLGSEQNWRCCYCGRRTNEAAQHGHEPSIEHVLPISLGGSHDYGNLVMACRDCNQARGNDIDWQPGAAPAKAPRPYG